MLYVFGRLERHFLPVPQLVAAAGDDRPLWVSDTFFVSKQPRNSLFLSPKKVNSIAGQTDISLSNGLSLVLLQILYAPPFQHLRDALQQEAAALPHVHVAPLQTEAVTEVPVLYGRCASFPEIA